MRLQIDSTQFLESRKRIGFSTNLQHCFIQIVVFARKFQPDMDVLRPTLMSAHTADL